MHLYFKLDICKIQSIKRNKYNIFKCVFLRKYATHLFTTPLSNVISDNMMSSLILTLTKQFFDNQFTRLKIKT